ncbi:hypothetical protein PGB90_003807 [Kerria lacca]
MNQNFWGVKSKVRKSGKLYQGTENNGWKIIKRLRRVKARAERNTRSRRDG